MQCIFIFQTYTLAMQEGENNIRLSRKVSNPQTQYAKQS
jgi:hypothetical protein